MVQPDVTPLGNSFFHPFDRAKPHILKWRSMRGLELALSEVEGANLEQVPRLVAGGVERFLFPEVLVPGIACYSKG